MKQQSKQQQQQQAPAHEQYDAKYYFTHGSTAAAHEQARKTTGSNMHVKSSPIKATSVFQKKRPSNSATTKKDPSNTSKEKLFQVVNGEGYGAITGKLIHKEGVRVNSRKGGEPLPMPKTGSEYLMSEQHEPNERLMTSGGRGQAHQKLATQAAFKSQDSSPHTQSGHPYKSAVAPPVIGPKRFANTSTTQLISKNPLFQNQSEAELFNRFIGQGAAPYNLGTSVAEIMQNSYSLHHLSPMTTANRKQYRNDRSSQVHAATEKNQQQQSIESAASLFNLQSVLSQQQPPSIRQTGQEVQRLFQQKHSARGEQPLSKSNSARHLAQTPHVLFSGRQLLQPQPIRDERSRSKSSRGVTEADKEYEKFNNNSISVQDLRSPKVPSQSKPEENQYVFKYQNPQLEQRSKQKTQAPFFVLEGGRVLRQQMTPPSSSSSRSSISRSRRLSSSVVNNNGGKQQQINAKKPQKLVKLQMPKQLLTPSQMLVMRTDASFGHNSQRNEGIPLNVSERVFTDQNEEGEEEGYDETQQICNEIPMHHQRRKSKEICVDRASSSEEELDDDNVSDQYEEEQPSELNALQTPPSASCEGDDSPVSSSMRSRIPLDHLFDYLISEEDKLYSMLHLINIGQLQELQQRITQSLKLEDEFEYVHIVEAIETKKKVDRPKFFAKQLHLTIVFANALVRLFSSQSSLTSQLQLQKYGQKLRAIYANSHQSFLLLIDLILNSSLCHQLSPMENKQYTYLKKLLQKKLKALAGSAKTNGIAGKTGVKMKRSQRLTQFRQNNEVSILNIKKICKALKNPNGVLIGSQIAGDSPSTQESLIRLSDFIIETLWSYERLSVAEVNQHISNLHKDKDEFTPFKKEKQTIGVLGGSISKQKLGFHHQSNQRKSQSPRIALSPKASPEALQSKVNSPKIKTKYGQKLVKVHSSNHSERSYGSVRSRSPSEQNNQDLLILEKQDSAQSGNSKSPIKKRHKLVTKNSANDHDQIYPGALPETIAFIVKNSIVDQIQQPGGVTNINNTINIYSTQTTNMINSSASTSQKDPAEEKKRKTSIVKKKGSPSKKTLLSGGTGGQKIIDTSKRPDSRQRGSEAPQIKSGGQIRVFNHQEIISSGKANLKTSSQKKHNFNDEQLNTPYKSNIMTKNDAGVKDSHSKTAHPVNNIRDFEEEIDDKIQVYKLSQNFVKQYKPMIKGKASKFSVIPNQQSQSNFFNHQPQQIIVSKRKEGPFNQHVPKFSEVSSVKSEQATPYTHQSSGTLKSSFKNSQNSSKHAQSFKDTLASAIVAAAHKGVSVLCDGDDVTLLHRATSEDFNRYVKKHINKAKKVKQPQNSIVIDEVAEEERDLFREEEERLDSLLSKMENDQSEHTFSSQLHDNNQVISRTSSTVFAESTTKSAKLLPDAFSFGNLLDGNKKGGFGLDLKKEMAYLKQNAMGEISTSKNPKLPLDYLQWSRKDDSIDMKFNEVTVRDPEPLKEEPLVTSHIIEDEKEEDDAGKEESPRDKMNTEERVVLAATTEERNKKKSDKMEIEFQKLKALVTIPYLPPLLSSIVNSRPVYTLVLDLDETLIHLECDEEGDEDQQEHEDGIYYLIRPGCIRFLNELAKYYEIVIFTAAMPDYADWIMDNIDRNRVVSHRLYRQHTTPHEDYAIKDLRNLGRPLERTIIIDNLAENFVHTTPNNGIWVESWYDDMDDNVLELLTPFLKSIVTCGQVPDVRALLNTTVKEKIIYRCLEQGKDIPPIEELLLSQESQQQV